MIALCAQQGQPPFRNIGEYQGVMIKATMVNLNEVSTRRALTKLIPTHKAIVPNCRQHTAPRLLELQNIILKRFVYRTRNRDVESWMTSDAERHWDRTVIRNTKRLGQRSFANQ